MAFDLSIMDYPAEFIRGWPSAPDSGTRETNRFKAANGFNCACGDLVVLNSNSELVAPTNGTLYSNFGIVVRGTTDDKSVRSTRRPIVLWGNYVVRTTKFDPTLVVGDTVVATALTVGGSGVFTAAAAATDANGGTVLQVIPGVGAQPASIIVEAK